MVMLTKDVKNLWHVAIGKFPLDIIKWEPTEMDFDPEQRFAMSYTITRDFEALPVANMFPNLATVLRGSVFLMFDPGMQKEPDVRIVIDYIRIGKFIEAYLDDFTITCDFNPVTKTWGNFVSEMP